MSHKILVSDTISEEGLKSLLDNNEFEVYILNDL